MMNGIMERLSNRKWRELLGLLPRQEYLTRERGWRRIDGREVDVRILKCDSEDKRPNPPRGMRLSSFRIN
jgi:hypothetical protein